MKGNQLTNSCPRFEAFGMGSFLVDSSTTHHDYTKIVPNARQDIMWCFQMCRTMNPQTI